MIEPVFLYERTLLSNLIVGQGFLRIYLPPYTMLPTSSYTFRLSCANASLSIAVATNGPPTSGSLAVIPAEGTELITLFDMTATGWYDEDPPLTYLFGFLSPVSGLLSSVQGRSEFTSASSYLPAGDALQSFMLLVTLSVSDSFDCSSQQNSSIMVKPMADTKALGELLMTTVNQTMTSGDFDEVKQAIAVVSSIISKPNCSMAPNCSQLNREPCLKTNGKCGACRSGFVGDPGDGNSLCLTVSQVTSGNGRMFHALRTAIVLITVDAICR
jgi:hypothetical protein